jgi:hypothetical protein
MQQTKRTYYPRNDKKETTMIVGYVGPTVAAPTSDDVSSPVSHQNLRKAKTQHPNIQKQHQRAQKNVDKSGIRTHADCSTSKFYTLVEGVLNLKLAP